MAITKYLKEKKKKIGKGVIILDSLVFTINSEESKLR